MIIQTPVIDGDYFAHRYVFEKAHDQLKMHAHEPQLEHNVRCVRGRVKIYGTWGGTNIGPGEVFQYPLGQQHCVMALEDNTETVHEYLSGLPAEYRELPLKELFGRITT